MKHSNIISHNCVNGRLYQMLNMKYGNPFVWCIVPPNDFYYLYCHYNSIDYKKIKIEKVGNDYKCTIDDKISIYYVHYKYDERCTVPTRKTEIDVYYNKIEDYIKEKYFKRLERMADKPVFIVTDREFPTKSCFNFNDDDLLKYVDKEDCIVVTCNKNIKGENVIYVQNKKLDPKDIAKIILTNDNKIF